MAKMPYRNEAAKSLMSTILIQELWNPLQQLKESVVVWSQLLQPEGGGEQPCMLIT